MECRSTLGNSGDCGASGVVDLWRGGKRLSMRLYRGVARMTLAQTLCSVKAGAEFVANVEIAIFYRDAIRHVFLGRAGVR